MRATRAVVLAFLPTQRQDDIAARMIDEFGYEVLLLSTEYDPKRSFVTSLGFKDPRTQRSS